jgi:hypothetical protein
VHAEAIDHHHRGTGYEHGVHRTAVSTTTSARSPAAPTVGFSSAAAATSATGIATSTSASAATSAASAPLTGPKHQRFEEGHDSERTFPLRVIATRRHILS